MSTALSQVYNTFLVHIYFKPSYREQNDLGRRIRFVKMGDMYECSILITKVGEWVGGWVGGSTDCISNSHAKDCSDTTATKIVHTKKKKKNTHSGPSGGKKFTELHTSSSSSPSCLDQVSGTFL